MYEKSFLIRKRDADTGCLYGISTIGYGMVAGINKTRSLHVTANHEHDEGRTFHRV